MLIWARTGVLPPIISLEGDPIAAMLHARGRFWHEDERGWVPCLYRFPKASMRCLACGRLNVRSARRSRFDAETACVHGSIAAAVNVSLGDCAERAAELAAKARDALRERTLQPGTAKRVSERTRFELASLACLKDEAETLLI
jgi:hypothetical protein